MVKWLASLVTLLSEVTFYHLAPRTWIDTSINSHPWSLPDFSWNAQEIPCLSEGKEVKK